MPAAAPVQAEDRQERNFCILPLELSYTGSFVEPEKQGERARQGCKLVRASVVFSVAVGNFKSYKAPSLYGKSEVVETPCRVLLIMEQLFL